MSEKKIRVEIVTPVHNRRDITLQCLTSIARLNSEGLEIQTIIVDDGSTDGTSEAIEMQFPNVQIIKGDGNLWFTEGTNVGVREAVEKKADYVLMINDDQIFDENAVKFMVETAEKYPRSVVGSLLLLWDTPHKLFQVSPRWETFSGGWRHWYRQTVWTVPKNAWEVDLIVGNCVLVPVGVFRECGLMDSKRFPNFGDAVFTPLLKKKGWRLLIDPRARVFCQPNYIPKRIVKMTFREKINALFFDLKHIQNLRRRFYAYWFSAPTKFQGVVGFFIFFIRIALRKNTEASWGATLEEKPISEVFADRILK